MKVIKHLKNQTIEEKIKKYFTTIPLLTFLIIPIIIILSLILSFSKYQQNNYFYQILVIIPISELVLFIIMALSDIKRQQQKGTLFIVIQYLIFGFTIFLFNATQSLFKNFNNFHLATTSIPMHFLIIVSFLDGLENRNSHKYLFIEPFSLRAIAYPFFIVLILNIVSWRIDVINAFAVGLLYHCLGLRKAIIKITLKIDRFISNSANRLHFVRTLCFDEDCGTVSGLSTSNSIVMEQK